jgi:hypothetical protein
MTSAGSRRRQSSKASTEAIENWEDDAVVNSSWRSYAGTPAKGQG